MFTIMKIYILILYVASVTQAGTLERKRLRRLDGSENVLKSSPNPNEGICTAATANANNYSAFNHSKECVFPFIYKGIEYHRCTGIEWTSLWCSTETTGEFIDGEWGNCDLWTCKEADSILKANPNPHEGVCTAAAANANGYSAFSNSKKCVFPFIYKGIEYHRCTGVEYDRLWCSTNTTATGEYYEGEWGNCDLGSCKEAVGISKANLNADEEICSAAIAIADKTYSSFENSKQCVFPFIYKGIEYSRCTGVDWGQLWCSTETSANGEYVDGEWGNCDLDV